MKDCSECEGIIAFLVFLLLISLVMNILVIKWRHEDNKLCSSYGLQELVRKDWKRCIFGIRHIDRKDDE